MRPSPRSAAVGLAVALLAVAGPTGGEMSPAARGPLRLATTPVYRPDLEPPARDRAIAIARAASATPDAAAHAITAYPPGGGFYADPVAYVSFHHGPPGEHDGAPFEGWLVDVATGEAMRSWSSTDVQSGTGGPRHDIERAAGTVPGLLDPPGRTIEWGGWSMTLEISGQQEGLALRDLRFDGHLLADKMSMPVMTVFYDGNRCGPFADRIGRPLPGIDWAGGQDIAYRQLTVDGIVWREVGVRALIGDYDLFQSYVFSANGVLEARLAGTGLQCQADHVHHPTFLLHPAIDGPGGDRAAPMMSPSQVAVTEVDAALGGGWRVSDGRTGAAFEMSPALLAVGVGPGERLTPVGGPQRIGVRRYRTTEDAGWRTGARRELPFGDDEVIVGGDIAVWWQGTMPHAAADGAGHWHATGVRLTATVGPPAPPDLGELVAAATATQGARRGT